MTRTDTQTLRITADASQAIQAIERLDGRLDRIIRTGDSVTRSLGRMQAAFSGFVGAFAIDTIFDFGNSLSDASDNAAELSVKLTGAAGSASLATNALEDLLDVARPLGADINELAAGYSRLAVAVPEAEHQELVDVLETLNFALKASGATIEEQIAVTRQFSQAMGASVLMGDEFTSLLEGAPVLIRAWGDAIGQGDLALKELRDEQVLTTDSFIEFRKEIRQTISDLTGVKEPATTVKGGIQAIRNEFDALFVELNQDGEPAFEEVGERLTESSVKIRELKPLVEGLTSLFASSANLAIDFALGIGEIVKYADLAATSIDRFLGAVPDPFGLYTSSAEKAAKETKKLEADFEDARKEYDRFVKELISQSGGQPFSPENIALLQEFAVGLQEIGGAQLEVAGNFSKLLEPINTASITVGDYTDALEGLRQVGQSVLQSNARLAEQEKKKVAAEKAAEESAKRQKEALKGQEKAARDAARAYEDLGREIERAFPRSDLIAGLYAQAGERRIENILGDPLDFRTFFTEITEESKPVWERFWDDLGDTGQQAAQSVAGQFVGAFTRVLQGGDIGDALTGAIQSSLPTLGTSLGTAFGGPLGGFAGGALGGIVGALTGGLFGGGGSSRDSYPIRFDQAFGDFSASAGPGAGPFQGFVEAIQAIDSAIADVVGPGGVDRLTATLQNWGPVFRRMEEGAFETQSAFEGVRARFQAIFAEAFPQYLGDLEQAADLQGIASIIDSITERANAVEAVAETFGISLDRAALHLDHVRERGEEYAETLQRISESQQAATSALNAMRESAEGLAAFREQFAQVRGESVADTFVRLRGAFVELALTGGSAEDQIKALGDTISAYTDLYNSRVAAIEASTQSALEAIKAQYDQSVKDSVAFYADQRQAARQWYDDQRDAAREWYDTQLRSIEAQTDAIDAQREVAEQMERAAEIFKRSADAARSLLDQLTFSEASPQSASQRLESVNAELRDLQAERRQIIQSGDTEGAGAVTERIVDLLRTRLRLTEEVFQRGSLEYQDAFDRTTRVLKQIEKSDSRRGDRLETDAQKQLSALDALETTLETELEKVREQFDSRIDILDQQFENRQTNIDRAEDRRLRELERHMEELSDREQRQREAALDREYRRYQVAMLEYQESGERIYRRQLEEQQKIVSRAQEQVGLSRQQLAELRQMNALLRSTGSIGRARGELRYG